MDGRKQLRSGLKNAALSDMADISQRKVATFDGLPATQPSGHNFRVRDHTDTIPFNSLQNQAFIENSRGESAHSRYNRKA